MSAILQLCPQVPWRRGESSFLSPGIGREWRREAACKKRLESVVVAAGAAKEAGKGAVVKVKRIEGVSEELNEIARKNIDFASVRRRVRAAFAHTQQQLHHPFFQFAPAGIQMEERYEVNSRGLEIFCKSWLPPPSVSPIKGCVFFCHGYGDTCTFFFEGIAKRIATAGYGVFAMDYPGFGLSQGLHGYIPSFDKLVDDVVEQYAKIRERPLVRDLPHFIFGQSMGGTVALEVQLKQPNGWDGIILVAPMCKIAEDVTPSSILLKAASLLSIVLPKTKFFPQQDLSELMFRETDKRKMVPFNVIAYNDQMRVRTAVELLKTTKKIESRLEKVSPPLLILHGAEDKVTEPQVSKFLYDKAKSIDKTLKLYEGGHHCILEGESDDRILQVLNDITSWLDLHSRIKAV